MESRLSGQDLGFDAPTNNNNDDENISSPAAYLVHHDDDPESHFEKRDWSEHQTSRLANALNILDDRSRAIIQSRWLNENKETLQNLAKQYGISAERVRQLESNAMKKLQSHIVA